MTNDALADRVQPIANNWASRTILALNDKTTAKGKRRERPIGKEARLCLCETVSEREGESVSRIWRPPGHSRSYLVALGR